jgi:MFS superfamily sulfate permease-like transporter
MYLVIFTVSLPLCCSFALLRGGSPERIIAALFLIANAATFVAGTGTTQPGVTRWGVFAVDVVMLISLGAVALRANRIWPLWITSMQLVTVLAHLSTMVRPATSPEAYRWSITVTSLAMLGALGLQTYMRMKRVTRFGADRSWSSF